jgi:regulator of sigma E protease
MRNLPNGLNYNHIAHEIGFRNGDIPVKVDGKEIEGYSGALMMDISEANTVTVLREGQMVEIEMPEDGVSLLEMQKEPRFFTMPVKPIVGLVAEGTPAEKYGIKKGDTILEIGSVPTYYINDVTLELGRRQDIIGAEGCTHEDSLRALNFPVVVLRENAVTPDTLQVQLGNDVKLGVMWDDSQLKNIKTEHISYTLIESIPAGFQLAWETLYDYVVSLKYLFNKEGVQQVGSFLTIGSLFPDTWDWHAFWSMTAFISIILAVMNILPIPGLDGGHIVLLLYEGIVGRQPSAKVLDVIEKIGLFLLFGLMILAFSNDIMRFFF